MKPDMMDLQWHKLHHMQIICTSLQTDNHASTSLLNFFTGWMLFVTPNQQCQSIWKMWFGLLLLTLLYTCR